MKKQVVHLTSETRRRALQLYKELGVLLRMDSSRDGLPGRSGFCCVRPSLYQMFSHLWGKDDPALTKVVSIEDLTSPDLF